MRIYRLHADTNAHQVKDLLASAAREAGVDEPVSFEFCTDKSGEPSARVWRNPHTAEFEVTLRGLDTTLTATRRDVAAGMVIVGLAFAIQARGQRLADAGISLL
jgi:hypothetical protein